MKPTFAFLASDATKQSVPDAMVEGDAENYFRRFPIFVVAFALVWVGLLGVIDQVWSGSGSYTGSLISFHAAAAFMLCGLAILLARSHVNAARTFACVLLALSFYCFLAYMSAGPAPAELMSFEMPLHISGAGAIVSGLVSLALILATLGEECRRYSRLLAIGAIVIAILFRYIPDWFALMYRAPDTANLAMLLWVFAGSAITALSRRYKVDNAFSDRGIAFVCILGTFISVLSWYALTERDRQATRNHAKDISEYVVQSLRSSANEQLALVESMTRRWDALDAMPSGKLVQEELQDYLNSSASLSLVAVLAPDRTIRWSQSRDTATRAWLNRYLAEGKLAGLLEHVHHSSHVHLSSVDETASHALMQVIGAPLGGAEMENWTIVAVQDTSRFIAKALERAAGPMFFRIHQGGYLLYDGTREQDHLSYMGEIGVSLHRDTSWRLSTWYGRPWLQPLDQLLPDIILILFLTFTFLLTRSQKLTSVLFERSRQLYHGSLHDPLTALPNKKKLDARLQAMCQDAMRSGGSVWVIMFDLDGIRLINDSMGHAAGDKVLQEVAKRLLAQTNDKGFVARMGGDEFVVVVSDRDRAAVLELTQKIISSIARPYRMEGIELRLTASAGITVSDGNPREAMELVREADLAMARAKREGRNTWYEYSSDLNALVAERLELRNKLQHALDTNGLELHYQPLVDGHTGRIVGAEALLRWPDPVRGYISPASFIPLSEETGQIIPLSNWVLNTACRDIGRLRSRNLADFPVLVNISPLHFQRADFVSSIQATLVAHSLCAESLEIEITEGVLLDSAAYTIAKLGELRSLGVKVSIDDFGTGYSSLNYLKNLPIDKIKIDRSFINDVISDGDDAAITKAIIDLAHHLNLTVIAEGVETESQFCFLKRNFCDEFQGYLFTKPMPFDVLAARLQENGCRVSLPAQEPES